jgi:AMP deaminase
LRHAITDDIVQIYNGVQHCLDLRRKYIRTSLQRSYDNPKNNVDRWRIYPDPPKPRWTYNAEDNIWVDHKHDLPKLGVGEDFNVKEIPIPGPDTKTFRLDNGVYQIYSDGESSSLDFIADSSFGTNC